MTGITWLENKMMMRATAAQPAFIRKSPNMAIVICFVGAIFLMCALFCISSADAYQLEGQKWPSPTATFYVDIPGADGLWNRSFENAMHYWGVNTPFQYRIVRGVYEDPCDPVNNKNGVGFSTTACEDEWGEQDLATTVYWYRGSEMVQADIMFNAKKSWHVYSTSWKAPPWQGLCDFQRVAVHELGHALGLDHEDSGVASIMTAMAGDITVPQQDDIDGVVALYGAGSNVTTPTGTTSPDTSDSSGGKSGCFIATAVYGSYHDPHVLVLRRFRDDCLLSNAIGRTFVALYYRASPPIAALIQEDESLRAVIRWMLTPVIYGVKYPNLSLVLLLSTIGLTVMLLKRTKS